MEWSTETDLVLTLLEDVKWTLSFTPEGDVTVDDIRFLTRFQCEILDGDHAALRPWLQSRTCHVPCVVRVA
jgi:hypothetical protein